MYGSSFRIETRRPRALSSRPTLAAVMPLPREEVTPPVTKTYFAMGRVLRGFFECYRNRPLRATAGSSQRGWVSPSRDAREASFSGRETPECCGPGRAMILVHRSGVWRSPSAIVDAADATPERRGKASTREQCLRDIGRAGQGEADVGLEAPTPA